MRFIGLKVTPKNSDPWPHEGDGDSYPQFGIVYTIRAIEIDADGTWLLLNEIRNAPAMYDDKLGELTFDAEEFRPVVEQRKFVSFTMGADPGSKRFDNRRKRVRA